MANNSDFVLDDDLDEDEEILHIHTTQQRVPDSVQLPDESTPPTTPTDPPRPGVRRFFLPPTSISISPTHSVSAPVTPRVGFGDAEEAKAVIIDGLPISSRRKDVDALLGPAAARISHLHPRRLEQDRLLRVRVKFDHEDVAREALALDGSEFRESVVSVKPSSLERWGTGHLSGSWSTPVSPRSPGLPGLPSLPSLPRTPRMPSLPKMPSLPQSPSQSLWAVFNSAKGVASQLEQRARRFGEQLEERLHMQEALQRGRRQMHELDASLQVSERVSELALRGKETASQVDRQLGISKGVGGVVGGVGDAAKLVAREVDENLRVSDKAREVANQAMSSPTVGGVARRVVSSLDAGGSGRKYRPHQLDLDDEHKAVAGAPSSVPAGEPPE